METAFTGRTKVAIVLRLGENSQGALTSVVATPSSRKGKEVCRFEGAVSVDERITRHVQTVLGPIVDVILDSLGLPLNHYILSFVNIGAASATGSSLQISGHSADVPILLSMLSASIGLPVPQNFVATGHIASSDGDISLVESIPAKIEAAVYDPDISMFVYPSTRSDMSLTMLSPESTQRAEDAIARSRRYIHSKAVRNVTEILQIFFNQGDIALASCRKGFLEHIASTPSLSHPAEEAYRFLALGNVPRFWHSLQESLLHKENDKAKQALVAWVEYYQKKASYPKEFGRDLLRLVGSIPPLLRSDRSFFPLLEKKAYVGIVKFAGESDCDDVNMLYQAMRGDNLIKVIPVSNTNIEQEEDPTSENEEYARILSELLTVIDEKRLSKEIGIPIDTARMSYALSSPTVESHKEFCETIAAYYLHLMRHHATISDPIQPQDVIEEANALLERAFSRNGGSIAAKREAMECTNGGLDLVLRTMTEHFKHELYEKRINWAFQEFIGPLDFEGKTAVIAALFKRFAAVLPPVILARPPEEFADHYESLVRTFAKAMGNVRGIFDHY